MDLPLLSVEEMRRWYHVGDAAKAAAEVLAEPAAAIRRSLRGLYTERPLGVWLHPEKLAALVEGEGPERRRLVEAVAAVHPVLEPDPARDDFAKLAEAGWVKVAYSPFLRHLGEWTGFFPGKYLGVLPNQSPTPVTAALTSGLLGAGLGYGAGWLGEKLLPERWQRGRLRKTLAVLGALPGAALGGAGILANVRTGKPWNSGEYLNHPAGAEPQLAGVSLGEPYAKAAEHFARQWAQAEDELIKTAWGDATPPILPAINVDALGRTLWESGADPATAGMTLGALAAARQMPGGSDPDWVTPAQMGQLAARMGAGYVSGALVGGALGVLAGLPQDTQQLLRRTGLYAGLVRAVVPRLFGQ